MNKINLQHKTEPKCGKGEIHWFENESIGLERTLFHRFNIPLIPFDSGLEYESQPVDAEIVFEWITLDLIDPINLDGIELTSTSEDNTEVSIYVGNAHNPCDIIRLKIKRIEGYVYELKCSLFVNFEHEMVAENEEFDFIAKIILDPVIYDWP